MNPRIIYRDGESFAERKNAQAVSSVRGLRVEHWTKNSALRA